MASTLPDSSAGSRDVPFASNAVGLSLGQWAVVAVVVIAVFRLAPRIWQRLERFEPGADYRVPYDLSNDYWLFDRWCRVACSQGKTLVIGDSVVWGQYVSANETLSHHLRARGGGRFANVGLDGAHPIALAGLLEHFGRSISGQRVILHYNPLWMTSRKRDLQTKKELRFNHPRLVPQFVPSIPCYRESCSNRLGIVVERHLSFLGWARHLRAAYFGGMGLPVWTVAHPYDSPLKPITRAPPPSDVEAHTEFVEWNRRVPGQQSFAWVPLATSMQWRSFRRALAILRRRKNRVFVLVGPLNEHMLTADSLEGHRRLTFRIETWLWKNGIPCYVPPALPSRHYADASHPSSEGYATLAEQLLASKRLAELVEETSAVH